MPSLLVVMQRNVTIFGLINNMKKHASKSLIGKFVTWEHATSYTST
jgi:hypothetical protein